MNRAVRHVRWTLTLAAALLLMALVSPAGVGRMGTAAAQGVQGADRSAQFVLGVAGQPVAGAWNPLRLELRDAPASTLTLNVDQGTLRSGEVPLVMTFDVRGGAGVSIFEELVYLPRFSTLGWRLTTDDRVLGSGSIAGREADERHLDLVLTSNPGAFRAAYRNTFGASTRLVDVTAPLLPLDPAAYDGVRSLVIDGTSAAPSLESVAAALAGGVAVALVGPLPNSHAELSFLLEGSEATRLGAGAILFVDGTRDEAVEALGAVELPHLPALQAELVREPLIEPPTPLRESVLVMFLAAYVVGVLLLLRVGGAPGLSAALALSGIVSLVAWQLLRPNEPQVTGGAVLAVTGGELATLRPVREVLTMPRSTLSLGQRVRPLQALAYSVDSSGTHLSLDRWRTVLLEYAPRLGEASLVWQGDAPHNRGQTVLHDVYLVGEGLLGDLAPGSRTPVPSETGSGAWAHAMAPQLPGGTLLARSGCPAECVTWVAYPPLRAAASTQASPPGERPVTDPFRGTPRPEENL